MGSAAALAHLPALSAARPGAAALIGVADCDASRLEAATALPVPPQTFDSLGAMLSAVRPQLLVVATPPSAHLEAVVAAVESGIHVLCEKPIGLSEGEVEALTALHREHPRTLIGTVLQYRHAPTWRVVGDAVAGARRQGRPFRLGVGVERPGPDPLSAGGWRLDAGGDGGILGDHAVHYLGLLWDLGAEAVVSSCSRSGSGPDQDAVARLSLAGGEAEITVSYRGSRRRNSITLELPDQGTGLRWEDAELVITTPGAPPVHRAVEALSDRSVVNCLYTPMYADLLDHLADASWRLRRTRETLGVAALLAAAIRTGGG